MVNDEVAWKMLPLWYLKGCPRDKGDLYRDWFMDGRYTCIQCGHQYESGIIRDFQEELEAISRLDSLQAMMKSKRGVYIG